MKSKTTNLFGLFFAVCLLWSATASAQLQLPRGSQMATVSQTVGITEISVTYSRPSVNGREIWGKLVPYGLNDFGFGTSKAAPWRAGANENTTLTVSDDVSIGGKPLKAGTYGLHMELHENGKVTVILSNNSTAWGSYFYTPDEDALRVEVDSKAIPHKEMLTFDFTKVTPNSATLALQWEKKEIPFTIDVDASKIVLTNIRKQLQSTAGFNRQGWEQAANYAVANGGDLNEALGWIDAAISGNNFSQQTFGNTQIKAAILNKLGRQDEAITLVDDFLPKATIFEAHQYGRQLIGFGKKDKALEVFKGNAKKHPNTWPVHYGMARGYSALGDYKTALKHLKKALENAPNAGSKGRVQANIDKLEKGEDIN